MKIIASVDSGKWNCKIVGKDINETATPTKVSLRTKIHNQNDGYMNIDTETNSHAVEFDGENYIVGDQGIRYTHGTNKTDFIHQITAYTALTELLEPNTKDNEIYLGLTCPVSTIRFENLREQYKNLIVNNNEPINIVVDDKEYNFTIKDVILVAEGSTVREIEPSLFRDKSTVLIDLGGANMTYGLYHNGVCKPLDRGIKELGTKALLQHVIMQFEGYMNGNEVSEDLAMRILVDGGLKYQGEIEEDSKAVLHTAKMNYYNDIIDFLKFNKVDVNTFDNVVFVGGTTYHIQDIIKDKLHHSTIPMHCEFTNSYGLYNVIYNKFKEQLEKECK